MKGCMSVYYAFEYPPGRIQSMGEPNQVTGDKNIKGQLFAFSTQGKRERFIQCEMATSRRARITHKGVRTVRLGMSLKMFREMLENIDVL